MTAARVILQLAAAVSAHATIVTTLPTGGLACLVDGVNQCANGSFGDAQLPTVNGIQGVKFFTNGPVDIFTTSGSMSLTLESSGTMGSIAGNTVIPFYYDFTLSGTGTTSGVSWDLFYSIS